MPRLYPLINLLLKVFNTEAVSSNQPPRIKLLMLRLYPLINLLLKVFNAEAVSSNQPRI